MANNKNPQVLKRSSDYESIKSSGKRVHPTKWMSLAYKANELGVLRFGFTISRKVGTAVIRNRLKRWGRVEFKKFTQSDQKMEVDINVIFRPMDDGFYKDLKHEEFKKSLSRGLRGIR